MPDWPSSVLAHFQARRPFTRRWLLWVDARELVTGDPVGLGVWDGDDHETVTIDGVARLYFGAQGGMDVPPIRYAKGTTIAELDIGLSLSPEGRALALNYDTRLAPARLDCGVFDPASGGLIGTARYFKGVVDRLTVDVGAVGGGARATVTLVSAARRGTAARMAKKSDASQRERDPDDDFRANGDQGVKAADPWGSKL